MAIKRKWFLFKREGLWGPFSSEEIKRLAKELDAIWGLGISPVSVSDWKKEKKDIELYLEKAYFLEHEKHIPRSKEELLDLLKPMKNEDLPFIRLFCHDEKRSYMVYEKEELALALGILNRKNIRAEVEGLVLIKKGKEKIIAPLSTISREGLGVKLKGEPFQGEVEIFIRTKLLKELVRLNAEVLYYKKGIMGLKFTTISDADEAKVKKLVEKGVKAF